VRGRVCEGLATRSLQPKPKDGPVALVGGGWRGGGVVVAWWWRGGGVVVLVLGADGAGWMWGVGLRV